MNQKTIHLGFEVGTGNLVDVPLRHLCVTGQTQESGKTTTLEALVARSGLRAVAFVTKRGEGSFSAGRQIEPYFSERGDWEFVSSILEASRHEKLKFERSWIIKVCKGTDTLHEVHENVKDALKTAKGINEGVYTVLDAYLENVIPQIDLLPVSHSIKLAPGINVMDLSAYTVEMQALVIRSTLEWVHEHEENVITIIPEAWEFIPQNRGSPVKLAAERLIRKGAALRNYIWLDSQDIAAMHKDILRSVSIWILGVQRETNEIKRNLANIPAGTAKPSASAIATLGIGEFYACFHKSVIKTYVQPTWMDETTARRVAMGEITIDQVQRAVSIPNPKTNLAAARAVLPTSKRKPRPLKDNVMSTTKSTRPVPPPVDPSLLLEQLAHMLAQKHPLAVGVPTPSATATARTGDQEALYQWIKSRLAADAPAVIRLMVETPEIELTIKRPTITVAGESLRGRIVRLLKDGNWFSTPRGATGTFAEVKRRGFSGANNTQRELEFLAEKGFLTKEDGGFQEVPGMKIHLKED